jgi:hypothetical protein
VANVELTPCEPTIKIEKSLPLNIFPSFEASNFPCSKGVNPRFRTYRYPPDERGGYSEPTTKKPEIIYQGRGSGVVTEAAACSLATDTRHHTEIAVFVAYRASRLDSGMLSIAHSSSLFSPPSQSAHCSPVTTVALHNLRAVLTRHLSTRGGIIKYLARPLCIIICGPVAEGLSRIGKSET